MIVSLNYLIKTVLDAHGMVGDSPCLASCCMLVCFGVLPNRPYSSSDSSNSGLWHFHLDIAGIQFTPLSFSHENNKLLVSFLCFFFVNFALSLPLNQEHHLAGEILYTIFFMVAITSILRMGCDLCFLRSQQLFYVYQYVHPAALLLFSF